MKTFDELRACYPCVSPAVPALGGAFYSAAVDTNLCKDDIIRELIALDWQTKRTARHEYFMSDTPRRYSYGNRGTGDETYESKPFSPLVQQLLHDVNHMIGARHNVCFLNKYDDDKQHLGWHADEFPLMVGEEPISVVSYGAEREIWVKDKRGLRCVPCGGDGELPASAPFAVPPLCPTCHGHGWVPGGVIPADQRVKLHNGSLFIMPPGYQDTHLHRIPKHDRPCDWRISLTFRTFHAPSAFVEGLYLEWKDWALLNDKQRLFFREASEAGMNYGTDHEGLRGHRRCWAMGARGTSNCFSVIVHEHWEHDGGATYFYTDEDDTLED